MTAQFPPQPTIEAWQTPCIERNRAANLPATLQEGSISVKRASPRFCGAYVLLLTLRNQRTHEASGDRPKVSAPPRTGSSLPRPHPVPLDEAPGSETALTIFGVQAIRAPIIRPTCFYELHIQLARDRVQPIVPRSLGTTPAPRTCTPQ